MKKCGGFAQIPIMIGMLVMAIALPVISQMVKRSQDTRNRAQGMTMFFVCLNDFNSQEPCSMMRQAMMYESFEQCQMANMNGQCFYTPGKCNCSNEDETYYFCDKEMGDVGRGKCTGEVWNSPEECMLRHGVCYPESQNPEKCGTDCPSGGEIIPTDTPVPSTPTPTEGWSKPTDTPMPEKEYEFCSKGVCGLSKFSSLEACKSQNPEGCWEKIGFSTMCSSLNCYKKTYLTCDRIKGECIITERMDDIDACKAIFTECWENDGLSGEQRRICDNECLKYITPTLTPTPTPTETPTPTPTVTLTPTPTPMSFRVCEVDANQENGNGGKCVVKKYSSATECKQDQPTNYPLTCIESTMENSENMCEGFCLSKVPTVIPRCDQFTEVVLRDNFVSDKLSGSNPYSVAVGDVNSDGKQDICVGFSNTAANNPEYIGGGNIKRCLINKDNQIYYWNSFESIVPKYNISAVRQYFNGVILGISKGGKIAQQPYFHPIGVGPINAVKIGDVINESNLYQLGNSYDISGQILVADMDNDNKDDFVVTVRNSEKLSIYFDSGDGTYERQEYPIGKGVNLMTLADIKDKNGVKDDLVVTNNNNDGQVGTISVLINNGEKRFNVSTYETVANNPIAVTADDYNKDGYDEVVVTTWSNGIVIFKNKMDGTLEYSSKIESSLDLQGAVSLNLNNDADIDLVTLVESGNKIIFWFNDGKGNFGVGNTKVTDFNSGTDNPGSLTAEDINGDGQKDLLFVTKSSNRLVIYTTCPQVIPICKTCVEEVGLTYTGGDRKGGDYNCDGVVNGLDFNIWREEKINGNRKYSNYWRADEGCYGEVKLSGYSVWRTAYLL